MSDSWCAVTLSTLRGSRMCGRQRACGKFSCRQVVATEVQIALDRCGLSGSSAEGDELRSHGNALGDFHADNRFERFQLP